MNGIRFPFALSLAGHAVFLTLLVLFAMKAPSLRAPAATGGIEVTVAPALPRPAAAPAAPAPPPTTLPPKVETPPPPSPTPKVETPPPPPPAAVEAAPPVAIEPPPPLPPPHKPVFRPIARPMPHRPAPNEPAPAASVQAPESAGTPAADSVPAARAPAPVASAEITPGYRTLLSAWLESHKRYPEGARERGEEGRAVLRFAVDRSGRVIDYAVIKSSGYPDLDAALENMMRGATLPPFPAGMTQPSITVAVTIRFSLDR